MRLYWGSLELTASPYMVEFGMDVGAPQNETQALAFMLQDGEVVLSERASTLTLAFNVLIEGADLGVMAESFAALIAESEKPLNTLTLDPEDSGPATVYETYRGQVSFVRNDNMEMSRLRRYAVTIQALPFPRSEDEVITPALAASGSTTTTLDSMGATTGWTGFINGSGATVVNAAGPPTTNSISQTDPADGTYVLAMQKTFAATTSSTNLLRVDWKPTYFGGTLTAIGDGVSLPLVAEQASPTAGYIRSHFKVAASSLAVTRFEYAVVVDNPFFTTTAPTLTLSLDNVAVTDVRPITGTGRQQIRSLTVEGSARTPGSLVLESATEALGDDTLVYVFPADESTNGYSPPLRQYRSSGQTVSTPVGGVSDSSEPLNSGGTTFDVPVSQFPDGMYLLLARLSFASGGNVTVNYSAKVSISGNVHGTFSGSRTVPLTNAYTTHVLARLQLPTVAADRASGAVMSLTVNTGATAAIYDEMWLFNTSVGQLTWVDCGTGSGSSGSVNARRIFIDSPSIATPRPTLRIGHAANRSDSYYPVGKIKAWQVPEFRRRVNVLTVTPNIANSSLSLLYYPRWHTHAAS